MQFAPVSGRSQPPCKVVGRFLRDASGLLGVGLGPSEVWSWSCATVGPAAQIAQCRYRSSGPRRGCSGTTGSTPKPGTGVSGLRAGMYRPAGASKSLPQQHEADNHMEVTHKTIPERLMDETAQGILRINMYTDDRASFVAREYDGRMDHAALTKCLQGNV